VGTGGPANDVAPSSTGVKDQEEVLLALWNQPPVVDMEDLDSGTVVASAIPVAAVQPGRGCWAGGDLERVPLGPQLPPSPMARWLGMAGTSDH